VGSDGSVVIVTGAARGLGRDYARFFAAEGARVVVADVAAEAAKETAAEIASRSTGARAIAVGVDVTDRASTLALAERTVAELGRIDVLVNNAGIWGDLERMSLVDTPDAYWDMVMGVNVKGALLCSQAVAPTMRAQGTGRIINISSMGAYMPSGVYGVSKLALNQLTYALASELGPDGITVNAVAPGAIDNEATQRQVPPAGMDKMIAGTFMKRAGTSTDVFGMIRYLASDAACWVTGQTFLVNGGYNTRL
jgi:3-oxoacyl-[acyl-carrier protein] reductase